MSHENPQSQQEVDDLVIRNSSENSRLLSKLSSLSAAPGILRGHLISVSKTQDELIAQISALEELQQRVSENLRSHKKYRNGSYRHIFARATRMLGKFEAERQKRERAYFDSLADQSRAEKRQGQLQMQLAALVDRKSLLETEVSEHEQAHIRLDQLYEGVFAGLTPGYPDEDTREQTYKQALARHNDVKSSILATRRAQKYLEPTPGNIRRAEANLAYAQMVIEDSFLFFDDAYHNIARTNSYLDAIVRSLSLAEATLAGKPPPAQPRVASLFDTSTSSLLHLDPIGTGPNLRAPPDASKFSPSELDTLKSLHKTLHQSRISSFNTADPSRRYLLSILPTALTSLRATAALHTELSAHLAAREKASLATLKTSARELEDARQALHAIRRHIFESVSGFGEAAPAYNAQPPLPHYDECCDRAEWSCALPSPEPVEEAPAALEGDEVAEAEESGGMDAVAEMARSRIDERGHEHDAQEGAGSGEVAELHEDQQSSQGREEAADSVHGDEQEAHEERMLEQSVRHEKDMQ